MRESQVSITVCMQATFDSSRSENLLIILDSHPLIPMVCTSFPKMQLLPKEDASNVDRNDLCRLNSS